MRSWPRIRSGSRNVVMMQTLDYGWHYFAQRYNITLRVLQGGSARRLTPLNTAPIFVDQFVTPSKHLQVLGIREPDGVLKPFGNDSYLQLMRENVLVIGRGLRRAVREETMRTRRMYGEQ